MHLLNVQLMFSFLCNTEMFKNYLMFILKNVSPQDTLGKLFKENGKLSKQTLEKREAQKISKRLDIDLRNSLAHLMFREDGATIHYYNYIKRGNDVILHESEIKSTDLFIKNREQSLIRTILALVITDWYGL